MFFLIRPRSSHNGLIPIMLYFSNQYLVNRFMMTRQIFADTHCHTVAGTHAYSTVHDYLAQAKEIGLKLFTLTDHAPPVPDAPHLWHFGNRRVIPRVVDGIAILRGVEANIENISGTMSIPDNLYPMLDLVIASFHEPVFKPAGLTINTEAMVNTICRGDCQIIGHPGNPNFPIDIDTVVCAAKEHNVLIEINNSSLTGSRTGSAENCRTILETVAKYDWKVSFASDAHIAFNLGCFDHCMDLCEDVGFPLDHVVSSTPEKLLAFLAEHDKPVVQELGSWLS